MRISIVTPSFNQARYLEAAINSVLNQNYPDVEYIIVDGGSDDGSVEIIRKYQKHLKWWVSERDQGQTEAINKGFAHASGEIFAWLNSDDTYLSGAFAEAATFICDNPDVGLVYGDADFINAEGIRVGRFPARQTDYHRLRQGYVHIPQQASFFRANLWKSLGPLDPSFYFAMDYDLWMRIARYHTIIYTPRLWANFRLHGDAKTISADDRCWPEMLRVHYREGGSRFSVIVAKHYLRKILGPIIRWRRRKYLTR